MKKQILILVVTAFVMMSFTGDKPAYLLYDQSGKKVKYSKMMKALEEADMIFFGELHTDPIAHWLQIEMTKELHKRKKDALVLGAEMFEADNQLILNEYLEGMYAADKFEVEMRLWGNYQTDYKPVVEYARENNIPIIATNIPRRYASMVFKGGFEALDDLAPEAKAFMAPLPMRYDPEVRCYKDMLSMPEMGTTTHRKEKTMPSEDTTMSEKPAAMHGKPEGVPGKPGSMPGKPGGMPGMGKEMPSMENLPKAQAAKDATMAHFILRNWSPGKTMFHFNGSYHSDNFEGIVWHLLQEKPDLKIMTLSLVQQETIDEVAEENRGIASYIICVPESMTRTKR